MRNRDCLNIIRCREGTLNAIIERHSHASNQPSESGAEVPGGVVYVRCRLTGSAATPACRTASDRLHAVVLSTSGAGLKARPEPPEPTTTASQSGSNTLRVRLDPTSDDL